MITKTKYLLALSALTLFTGNVVFAAAPYNDADIYEDAEQLRKYLENELETATIIDSDNQIISLETMQKPPEWTHEGLKGYTEHKSSYSKKYTAITPNGLAFSVECCFGNTVNGAWMVATRFNILSEQSDADKEASLQKVESLKGKIAHLYP